MEVLVTSIFFSKSKHPSKTKAPHQKAPSAGFIRGFKAGGARDLSLSYPLSVFQLPIQEMPHTQHG